VAASTIATFDAFIKEFYNDQTVQDLTKAGKPFFGRINTNTEVSGDPWVVPILLGNPQGVTGGTRAQAQSAATNTISYKWQISMADTPGSVNIGDKVMMASRNNMGSFLQDKETEISGLYETASTEIAIKLWRNGGGASGQVAAITGNVVQLTNPQDAMYWEIGEIAAACADDGTVTTTTPRVSTTSAILTAVDYINGTITFPVAQITGLVVGDFLFRYGNVVANTGINPFTGVQAYITPSATPGALWGISAATRLTNLVRYSGGKLTTAQMGGKGIEERIQLLGAKMQGMFRAMGAGTWEVYLHPEDWQTLNGSVQNRGQRSLTDESTKMAYEYIDVVAGGKRMKTFSDPFVPKGSGFILKMDNFVLGSYGPLLTPVNGDGLQMLRLATTDDYEFRLKSYANMSNNAPSFSGTFLSP